MTRKRLRPAWDAATLQRIYARPHDHRAWSDHHLRVDVTIALARWMADADGATSAADLSCGNGTILGAVPVVERHMGDFAPGWDYHGPIEHTISQIPAVDLFVCSETLEHLDDPDTTLRAIRARAGSLVLTTPVDAWSDNNLEHYWAWSAEDVSAMLASAGWRVDVHATLDFRPMGLAYCFGIWGAR